MKFLERYKSQVTRFLPEKGGFFFLLLVGDINNQHPNNISRITFFPGTV